MMKFGFLSFLLLGALLIPLAHAAVPSESALDAASAYLRQGEGATTLPDIYTVEAKPYWVVYLHPQNSPDARNLVVIVDANSGQVVTDEKTLLKVYQFERKLTNFQSFEKQTNLDITTIDNKLKSGDLERTQADNALQSLDDVLLDYGENVRDLMGKQSVVFNHADLLRQDLEIVSENERKFEEEKSEVALNDFMTKYNDTLSELTKFIESSEAYRAAIINKTSELGKKPAIPSAKYRSALETAFSIGISDFPTSPVLKSYLQDLVQISDTSKAANDTLASFTYRKRKSESDKLIQSAQGQVEQILSSKVDLASCTKVDKLEAAWNAVKAAQQANDFDKVTKQVAIANSEVEKIKAKYDQCTAAANQQNDTQAQKQDNSIYYYAAALLLIVAVYFVYKFTQKKKEDKENGIGGGSNGSSDLSAPASGKTLFTQ